MGTDSRNNEATSARSTQSSQTLIRIALVAILVVCGCAIVFYSGIKVSAPTQPSAQTVSTIRVTMPKGFERILDAANSSGLSTTQPLTPSEGVTTVLSPPPPPPLPSPSPAPPVVVVDIPPPTLIKMTDPSPFPAWDTPGFRNSSWGNPRLFEAFLFYNEIELLEVRMAELFDIVEKFVIVETTIRFGDSKPAKCYFDELKHQLPERFRSKIAHFKCELISRGSPWDREHNARECAKRAAFFAGLQHFDLLHFSDADEIARHVSFSSILSLTRELMRVTSPDNAESIKELRAVFPIGVTMRYYAHNFRTIDSTSNKPNWFTDLFLIFDTGTMREHVRRNGHRTSFTREAGWHCSWCFPRVAQFEEKFFAFSHTETIDPRNYAAENVWSATCHGGNLFRYRGPQDRSSRRVVDGGYFTPPQYLWDKVKAGDPRFLFLIPDNVTCRIPL